MKGHISIRGDFKLLKPAINQLDSIGRYRKGGRSIDYDCGDCRADYFYDEYEIAELDFGIVVDETNKDFIKIEEW